MAYDNYQLTNDDKIAEQRAEEWKDKDPFEDGIPRALLSKEHIRNYVRVTGMLCPFYPADDRLKSASYEAWPVRFIRWDANDRKSITEVITPREKREYEKNGYELPANSITFVQIESRIRLPNYIALRFNLRITHVHRGLLLGTGPLVDPGFDGDLLIPLHNLTSEPYRIKKGIIWIEFTKMSAISSPPEDFRKNKVRLTFEQYFEKASGNNPIQSSIPKAVQEAKTSAQQAKADARKAARTNLFFASLGFLAILGMIVTAANFAISLVEKTNVASKDASLASAATNRNETAVGTMQKELSETRKALSAAESDIKELRQRLDQMK